ITQPNETFRRHHGPTDVITFDYAVEQASSLLSSRQASGLASKAPPKRARPGAVAASLHGEIFICTDEAISQARRFHTTWQSELTRYVIHGLLHLCGYDDQRAAARRQMKREEARLLDQIARQFD